jgi:hypothetical protein
MGSRSGFVFLFSFWRSAALHTNASRKNKYPLPNLCFIFRMIFGCLPSGGVYILINYRIFEPDIFVLYLCGRAFFFGCLMLNSYLDMDWYILLHGFHK